MSAFFNLKALQSAAATAIGLIIALSLLPADTVAELYGSRLNGIVYGIILGVSIGYTTGLAWERSKKSQD